jgi:hypothetical protein
MTDTATKPSHSRPSGPRCAPRVPGLRRVRSAHPPFRACTVVLASAGRGRECSPFESARSTRSPEPSLALLARTPGPHVGQSVVLGLTPPQPPAVLAPLRASALARLETVGVRRYCSRDELARGGGRRPPARAGWTDGPGTHQPSRRVGRLVPGPGSALALQPWRPRAERACRNTTARARGGVGPLALRWNRHARTLGANDGVLVESKGERSRPRPDDASTATSDRRERVRSAARRGGSRARGLRTGLHRRCHPERARGLRTGRRHPE